MAQFLSNERFGNSSDGAYSPSTGTDAPIDSACTGTINTTSLLATNGSFAAGQLILIHQTRGAGAGQWELNKISSYIAGTITTKYKLTYGYISGAQVLVMPQYASGNIAGGVTLTGKAWNGTVGGIYAKFGNGTFTVPGSLVGSGIGFRGGVGGNRDQPVAGQSGESDLGIGQQVSGDNTNSATNGPGGQGGHGQSGGGTALGGGGGGHTNAGSHVDVSIAGGTASSDTANLTIMLFGGGGGGGGAAPGEDNPKDYGQLGGNSGGMILIIAKTIIITGSMPTAGLSGANSAHPSFEEGGGGGGSGGSILLKGQTIILGSNLVTSLYGNGGAGSKSYQSGGNGSVGRIHADYSTSISGTTNPSIDSTQDRTLADSFQGGMI
jgi:hypothetical protein